MMGHDLGFKVSGRTPHPCDICGKVFRDGLDLKRHSMVHTGQKPYHCSLCSKRFRQKAHLKRHFKEKHHRDPEAHELIPDDITKMNC